MSGDYEERRQNIGDSCDLYHKCFQMHTGWELFAKEVTKVKQDLSELKETEKQATKDRKETSDEVKAMRQDLRKHTEDEMTMQKQNAEVTREHTTVLSKLTEAIQDLHKSNRDLHDKYEDIRDNLRDEKNDTKWMKLIGWGAISIATVCLVWLFSFANTAGHDVREIKTSITYIEKMFKGE